MNAIAKFLVAVDRHEREEIFYTVWNKGQRLIREMVVELYADEREATEWIDLGGES